MLVLNRIGLLGGNPVELTTAHGLMYLAACLPIAIVGLFSAIAQGRTAAAGIGVVAKKPDQNGKAITMAVLVETYAVLALLISPADGAQSVIHLDQVEMQCTICKLHRKDGHANDRP